MAILSAQGFNALTVQKIGAAGIFHQSGQSTAVAGFAMVVGDNEAGKIKAGL